MNMLDASVGSPGMINDVWCDAVITFPFGNVASIGNWHCVGVVQYDDGMMKCPEHPESKMVDCSVLVVVWVLIHALRWGHW